MKNSKFPTQPPLSRRNFALGIGVGAPLFLAGCQTNPILQGISQAANNLTRSIGSAFGTRDIYREKSNTPEMMQHAFDLYKNASNGDLMKYYLSRLKAETAKHEQAIQELEKKVQNNNIQDIFDVSQSLEAGGLPALRQLHCVFSLQDRVRSKTKPTVKNKGRNVYELSPGSGIQVVQKGKCMDPSIPAPVKGELLELHYIDSRLPKSLRPVFKALCNWAAVTNDASAQTLTWIIMTAGDEHGYCARMNQEHYNKLQAIYPNGGNIVRSQHNGMVMTKRLVDKALKKTALGKYLGQADLNSSRQVDRAVEQELNELIQAGLREGGQGQPGFSLLGPNLTSKAVGKDVLTAEYTIFNAEPFPVTIETTDFFAKPRRNRQSISPVPGSQPPKSLDFQSKNKISAQQHKEIKELADKNKSFLDKWADLIKLASTKSAEIAAALRDFGFGKFLLQNLDKNSNMLKFLSGLGTTLPIVGNALSFIELISGRDWLTQKPLTDAQMFGALIGTIPGAGAFKSFASMAGWKFFSSGASQSAAALASAANRIAEVPALKMLDKPRMSAAKDMFSAGLGALGGQNYSWPSIRTLENAVTPRLQAMFQGFSL